MLTTFSGGEVSPGAYGQLKLNVYYASAQRLQNFLPRLQGPLEYRGGTQYGHNTASNNKVRIEPFSFNDEQSYILEFTNGVLRIYEDAGLTVDPTGKTITGATQANPVVITATAHGFSDGDEVRITDVVGMTELNTRFFRVANSTANTFELQDLYDNNVDGTGFTAYSSGGTATKVYEVVSPYNATEISEFQFAQQGNIMYIAHRSFAPYKLTRISSTSWTLATYTRTTDPFTGAGDFPGAVAFFEGRLVFASTDNNPDTVWASRAPTSAGVSRYDDFTLGTAAADDAIIFPISPSAQGSIAYIVWLAAAKDFIAVGTTGGILGLDGGGNNAAITPTTVRVRPLSPIGAQDIMAIANGASLFYMQKGSRILRSFEYDILSDSYNSINRTFVSGHLMKGGVKKIAFQRGKFNDYVLVVRNDGVLLSMIVKPKEDPTGWSRHILGGSGKVLDVAVEPTVGNIDRVWVAVERTINSTTVRYLEYFKEPFEGLEKEDYFTDDEELDITAFENETYEKQRTTQYLDSSLVFDGSNHGTITMTPGAVTGSGITFTASSSLFASGDVGKRIIKKYENRAGGGVAEIIGFSSDTQVTCTILSDFDTTTAIPAGSWFLTTDTISGLHHLEGETIQVQTDGRVHPDVIVSAGKITLNRQAGYIVGGLKYIGIYISLPIVGLDNQGPSPSQVRNIDKVDVLFFQSIGTKYGTNLYDLQQVFSSKVGQKTDRPPVPLTGIVTNYYEDDWDVDKLFVVVQDQAYPCFVNSINLHVDGGEE